MRLLWSECTWEDIAVAAREDYIAVLPTGAIEQHGPMLPVDVDAGGGEAGGSTARSGRETSMGSMCWCSPRSPMGSLAST